MSGKNDINKVLNSSDELEGFDDGYEQKKLNNFEPKKPIVEEKDPEPVISSYNSRTLSDYESENNYYESRQSTLDENIHYINDEPSRVENNNQKKITITRNIGKVFDVPDDAIVQTMKDNKTFHKKFNVKILGIGGAGNNIIRYVYNSRSWPDFVEICALNTDYIALKSMPELNNSLYLIGQDELNGNGSGGDPEMGKKAANSDAERIKEMLEGTDVLMLVAGLGKGTGTGATPVIAEIAKELGILTIGIFNLPSIAAEGNKTYTNAVNGLEKLSLICDGYTAISNDKIIGMDRERISIKKAYQDANEYIRTIIDEIINVITKASDVNIDFSDIKNFFKDQNGFLYLKVDVADYTKDAIKECIKEKYERGYTDIDINESKSAIFDIKMNENVPSNLLEHSRTAMKEIVRSNDLNIVQGISFNDKYENAEINILIAGKFDLGQIRNSSLNKIESNDFDMNYNFSNEEKELSIDELTNDSMSSILEEFNNSSNNEYNGLNIQNDLNIKEIDESKEIDDKKKTPWYKKIFQ